MRANVMTLALEAAGVALLAACGGSTSPYGGGGGGGGNCTPTPTTICMANTLFNPATKTVSSGATVTWQNADAVGHTATSNPSNPAGCPTWDVSVGAGTTSGGTALNASSTPVTCQYYCTIHATPTAGAMRASVTIQ